MNRLRLWGYVVLLLVVGLGNLYFVSGWIGARSLAQLDHDLRAAATLLEGRSRLLAADAGALAEAASRSPAVASPDPLSAANDAIRPAAEAMKLDPKALLVGVAGPQGVAIRASGQQVSLPDGAPIVADPQRGVRRDGFARAGDRVWSVAGVPAGRGAAVLVGLPLDVGFVTALRAASGVEATVVVDGKPVATSVRPEAPREIAAAAVQPPRRVADVGRLGPVKGYLSLPAMPLLFTSAPETRAYLVPLEGAPGVVVVLSLAAAPLFVGLATYQVASLIVLAVLLVLGVVLGLLMSDEGGRAIPRELLHAADRVNRGDFKARAPVLAGSAGVLASALNRAAEAASGFWVSEAKPAAKPSAAPVETGTQPIFAPPAPSPAAVMEPEATAAWSASPAEAPAPAALAGASVEPVPSEPVAAPFVAEPKRAPEPEPIPPAPEPAPGVIPELPPPPAAEMTSPAAGPEVSPAGASLAEEEESHWRMVFDDFLRVRGETGEGGAAVSFERFRTRLQKNRDQLIDKYGCRTVRFQVYVKVGKAAVRATPVR